MSNYILTVEQSREAEAVILDIVGEGEVEKYARELVWLRARVAELLARVPDEGDVVLVPRDVLHSVVLVALIGRGAIEESDFSSAHIASLDESIFYVQSCLGAPQTRVVQEGDVVIPCNLSERLHHGLFISDEGANGWWASIGSQGLTAPTREAAIDALARAIGETKCK